jgi:hypothetical protein
MPRRSLLTPAERIDLLAFPGTGGNLIRHYTFSELDLSVIRQRRRYAHQERISTSGCYLIFRH